MLKHSMTLNDDSFCILRIGASRQDSTLVKASQCFEKFSPNSDIGLLNERTLYVLGVS